MAYGKIRIALLAILFASLQWGSGVNYNDKKLAGASPKSKQAYVVVPRPNFFPRRPPFPIFIARAPISVARAPISVAPRRPRIDLSLLMFTFLIGMMKTHPAPTTASTTATATTTTDAPTTTLDCAWGIWGTCSLVCGGTRTRIRTCNGVADESQNERCNTEPAFQNDGWYRATNCLEYVVIGTAQNHEASTTHCEDTLGGRLASTGMRDYAIRLEILEKLFEAQGIVLDAWVGINNIDDINTYVWTEGPDGMPNFWNQFQPSTPAHRCHVVILGNPRSLGDLSCTSNQQAICERTIP